MSRPASINASGAFTPILIASCAILLINFGIRASYGVFQLPMITEFEWPRASFAMAVAIQNLAWGVFQPLFAMVAEKIGDRKALLIGALTYAAGLMLSTLATTPWGQNLTTGLLVGAGVAGTGFGVLLAVIGRAAPAHRRSLALGVATAAGSAGQVFGPPVARMLEAQIGWSSTLGLFAFVALGMILFLPFLKAPPRAPSQDARDSEPLFPLLRRVMKDPDYILLFLGFFACGFQLAFITVHFPAYVTEACATSSIDSATLGATAISLIGLANIFGSIIAGQLGGIFTKKYLLSLIYTLRTLVTILFLAFDPTPLSVILFSLSMGFLWLATVPLTSGIIAHIYGLRYMGTLYGFVFLSHQIGGFLGVWLGGRLYDLTGSYDMVWWIGIGVGAFSALAHLPIREKERGYEAAAA